MSNAFISLGSNIDPEHHLLQGAAALRAHCGLVAISSIYRSPAQGFEGPPFLNAAASIDTHMPLEDLVETLRSIERCNGRTRPSNKFSNRTLDLDLLTWDDRIGRLAGKQLPSDDIARYGFVLIPLAELAPNARHPVLHTRFADMLQTLPPQQRQLELVELTL